MLTQQVGPFIITVKKAEQNRLTGKWRSGYEMVRADDGVTVLIGYGPEFDDRDRALVDALSLGIAIASRKADGEGA